MPAFNGVGIHFFMVVLDIVNMPFVYSVTQAVAELELWGEFEEGEIKVAT